MRVKIIVPYFGEWPDWTDYFLLSCSSNPDLDWILIGDSEKKFKCPPNVEFVSMSLSEFNQLASSNLGMNIRIRNPYKICDLRPAFGIIFSSFLREADFWGYSDIDIIYGNLNHFLNTELFESTDLISPREEYLPGHFALFRNNERLNNLFRISPVHKNIFEDNHKHYAFDERSNYFGRSFPHLKGWKWYDAIHGHFEKAINKTKLKLNAGILQHPPDMNTITGIEEMNGKIRVFRKNMVKSDLWFYKHRIPDWEIRWTNGILTDHKNEEQLLHFHFLRNKNNPGFRIEKPDNSKSFKISPGGITQP